MATQVHVESEATQGATQEGPRLPQACGYCRNCNIGVDDHIVFCEPFCQQQWLHERGAGPAPVR